MKSARQEISHQTECNIILQILTVLQRPSTKRPYPLSPFRKAVDLIGTQPRSMHPDDGGDGYETETLRGCRNLGGSLDAKLRREMRAEVDRLHQGLGKTFIYVTHDQEEAMTLADRIVVMRAGEIEQVGTPLEIYSDPVSLFVADFFGSPSMNLIPGTIEKSNGGVVFRNARTSIALPPTFSEAEPGPGTLGIRPEHLFLFHEGGRRVGRAG